MPHDATPDNGRMRPVRPPSWSLAFALAATFALGAALVAAATGVFLFALPAIAVVVVAYGAYHLFANRWRRTLPHEFRRPRSARSGGMRGSISSVIEDARAGRRRSRSVGPELP